MAGSTKPVNEKGISILFEATCPTLEYVLPLGSSTLDQRLYLTPGFLPIITSIVFVHGFTGHPERTWSIQVKDAGPIHAHSTSQPIGYDTNLSHPETSSPFKRPRPDSLTDGSTIDEPRPPKLSRLLSSSFRRSDSSYDRKVTTKRTVYWPRDLVPETLPNARVLTYGYDTNVRSRLVGPISRNTVGDHGWDLLCALGDIRREDPLRPLLFVCHSLGGLVSKIALMRSNECRSDKPHLYKILESTIGVFFFGTPHRGADPLGIARGALTALAKGITLQLNDNVVAALMPGGDYLKSIRDGFMSLGRQRQWNVFSFQEEYGLGGLGGNKVVDDVSSQIDDASIETTRHIAKNHMEMVRFSGSADPEYQKVASALRFIHDKILSKQGSATQESTTQLSNITAVTSANLISPSLLLPVGSKEAIESRKELTDLLYFDELDARLLSLKPALNKTCNWFLEKPEYLEWLHFQNYDKHHGFLWIKGKPGAGKSILMKFLEAKTKALATQHPDHIVASFFFFAPGQHLERSTLGLYRSLLWQLFEKVPDLAEVLDCLDSNARRVLIRTGWQIETLKETLERAIERLGRRELCLFIDALDECYDDDVADMVGFFEDLGDNAAEKNIRLRICFSSRYYPTIVLKSGTEVKLDREEEHSQDITRYIKLKLKLDKSKRAGAISQQILEKSAGIFLWVALVVPILNKAFARGRMDQLQKSLNEMPPGLDNLFDMILMRDQDDLDDLRLCIQWILFAVRPLTLVEYFFALRDADDTDALSCWAEKELDNESMHRFVENSSKGLAEVTKTRSKTKDPTVQFIHESVRDYFLLKEGKRILWQHLEGDFVAFSHESLKVRCLAEIINLKEQVKIARAAASQGSRNDSEYEDERDVKDDEDDGDASSTSCEAPERKDMGTSLTPLATSIDVRPLLPYATTGVLQHSDLAQRQGLTQSIFLTDEFPSSLQTWVHLHNEFEERKSRHLNSNASIIYILAALGLSNLLSVHPQLSSHNDSMHLGSGRYFSPFAAAVILKHKEAACVLASSLSADPEFSTGIEDAVASSQYKSTNKIDGSIAFFDLLFELGHAPLISRYIELWSSRFETWCIAEVFTRIRSAEIASVVLKGILCLTFHRFNQSSYPRIERLISKGADPNTQSRDGDSALHWIIKHYEGFGRSPTLMRSLGELLDCGIDRNLRDSLGRTPLHYATSPEVISALINPSAPIHQIGGTKSKGPRVESDISSGSSPLRPICLDVDVPDVNAVDNMGKTPLFFMPWILGISTIVEHGANIHVIDNMGRTPLHSAKSPDALRYLIQNGLDVHARDHNGQTPLHWHVQHMKTYPSVEVQLAVLINNGADVFSKDSEGKTPLDFVTDEFLREKMLEVYNKLHPASM